MPTEQEWREGLAKWQKAVAGRDERIRDLKEEVAQLGNRKRYQDDRLGVLEPLAKLLLREAHLPGNNNQLLDDIAKLLPGFQEAVERLKKDGVDAVLEVILKPPPLEEAGEAKPVGNDKGGKPKA